MNLTIRLMKTLGLSWLTFLVIGLMIHWLLPIPHLTILIDRSYCPANQWQDVSQEYAVLYHQHQRRQLKLIPVVMFSNLGQEVFDMPPIPQSIQTLSTYGKRDRQRQRALQAQYSQTQLLSCQYESSISVSGSYGT